MPSLVPRSLLILFPALLAAQVPPVAPPAPASSLAAARAQLQAGHPGAARPILEALAKRTPKDPAVWRLLGSCALQLKDPAAALEAFRRALALAPEDPASLYNAGAACARLGRKDEALAWLGRAKATGKLDLSQAAVDEDLAPLWKDPRLAALLPGPDDFARPFLEPAKVLHTLLGEASGDQFGWIARDLGDVDGDGAHDAVISAPTKALGGPAAGRIYVFSGRTGRRIWSADGRPGDTLGSGLESAGDTDGDGAADVIAGAPGAVEGRGRAVLYGGRDGRVLRTFEAPEGARAFGVHVGTAGDLDGDGRADVLIGASGGGAGAAFVYSGRDGHLLAALQGERAGDRFGSAVAGGAGFLVIGAPAAGPDHHGRAYVYRGFPPKLTATLDAGPTGQALGGMFAAVLGDTDGDGVADLFVSDWRDGAKGPSTGRIVVLSGATGRVRFTATGETAGEGFGTSSSVAGDVDGDGKADLVVGAWQHAGAAPSGGKVTLLSGADGRVLATFTGRIPWETLGFDAVGIGDTDGDGTVDLLLASAWSAQAGYHAGRVLIVSSGIRKARPESAPQGAATRP